MSGALAGVVGDHLWQSTLCAAGAALIALALRGGRADVRYWIWLGASVKFLVPFAALGAIGRQFSWRTAAAPAEPPAVMAAFDSVARPFASDALAAVGSSTMAAAGPAAWSSMLPWTAVAIWAAGIVVMAALWIIHWRRVASAVARATPIAAGRELDMLRRLERTAGARRAIALMASDGSLEPGVFGIRRPVLLWPVSISSRLSDTQIEGILAHELAHVRRYDNLTAALHMAVRALVWFYPLVWWLSARLVDERERACDQDVLRAGAEPGAYAEGILRTVQFYVESPLPCVAGVTGSDLKRRIEDIMRSHTGHALRAWQKALLASAALATLIVPIVRGSLAVTVVSAQAVTAPPGAMPVAFESASVKPNNTAEGRVSMRILPGGIYEALNVTVRAMIQQSNQLQEFQVIGGPDWLATQRIDILARSPAGGAQAELMPRLRTLLEERFKLKTHRETREAPIYALVLARDDRQLGPSIKPNPAPCAPAGGRGPAGGGPSPATSPADAAAVRRNLDAAEAARGVGAAGRGPVPMQMSMELGPLGSRECVGMMSNGGRMISGAQTMAQIAQALQRQTGRIVQDRTGLTGRYDFDLAFTPDPQLGGRGPGGGLPANIENPRPIDPNAISIFTAVQEQLGLRLEAARGPVDVLIIDSAERLVEN